ncbi:MAG: putative toxin-antitoxin system toxin component, PIN family [Chloroflexota bacterium]|nr:putative toxin-antitoxin system toxin component, PIN family [Chloroflexota bacterium]
MRAVVDTNILIRALIKPDGTVGPVLKRLAANDYTLVYSESILDELLAKFALPRIRQKYHLDDHAIETVLALFALRGVLVHPTRRVQVCRDPKDDMIIEAALEGAAEYIVTGDEDLLTLKRFEKIQIVTPRIFLAAF